MPRAAVERNIVVGERRIDRSIAVDRVGVGAELRRQLPSVRAVVLNHVARGNRVDHRELVGLHADAIERVEDNLVICQVDVGNGDPGGFDVDTVPAVLLDQVVADGNVVCAASDRRRHDGIHNHVGAVEDTVGEVALDLVVRNGEVEAGRGGVSSWSVRRIPSRLLLSIVLYDQVPCTVEKYIVEAVTPSSPLLLMMLPVVAVPPSRTASPRHPLS